MIARVLLGAIFLVFGLNGFFNFLPAPEVSGNAGKFISALAGSSYISVIKLLEVIGGALVLWGKYLPLGLVLLSPIIVNILLFHLFLAPDGLIVAIVVTLLDVFLIRAYWGHFKSIVKSA